MIELIKKIEIEASPKSIWEVLIELEHWPEWTPSISNIERLGTEPLGVGTKVKIFQPKLAATVWTITEWEPEKSFVWESRRPGVHTRAKHIIKSKENISVLELVTEFRGLLGNIIGRLASKLTTQYLSLEAEGLKTRSEQNQLRTKLRNN